MAKKGSNGSLHLCKEFAKPYDHRVVEEALESERIRAIRAGLDFVFTVIVPVYNTEEYLEECIRSVANQTVGFGDIQLVLVDDGSSDGSAAICQRWANRFPKNVELVRQANAGVSAARNTGLSRARGLWVNFLDSDDMWTEDAFAQALAFHAAHPEQQAIAERHRFFGARNAPHALDYKFARDHVVDLNKDIDCVQHSFSNLFVESQLLKSLRFNTELEVSEDFALVNELLMDLGSYGACAGGAYMYRKRAGGGSAIDTSTFKASYYDQTPRYCYKALFDLSRERFGKVIPYIQYCVMYDIQWRLKVRVSPLVDEQVARDYKQTLVELLQDIDDQIIVAQREMDVNEVVYAMSLKYGTSAKDIQMSLCVQGTDLVWQRAQGNVVMWHMDEKLPSVHIAFLRAGEGKISLEGHFEFLSEFAKSSLALEFACGDESKEVQFVERPYLKVVTPFKQDEFCLTGFSVELPWDGKRAEVIPHFQIANKEVPVTLAFGKFVGINGGLTHSYWQHDGCLFTARDIPGAFTEKGYPQKGSLIVEKNNPAKAAALEQLLRADLVRTHEWGAHYAVWRAIALEARRRRELSPTKVWLISDRPLTAGDNGEALFAWLCEHPQEGVEPVFTLSRKSKDWDRVCSYGGRVVEYNSFEYKRLFLRANVIASSSGDEWAINALGPRRPFLKDLYGFRYAFLQHGVIKDDLSEWFNRYTKNASLFVTSAYREWESIVRGGYGYDEKVVRQTGLPRHDALLAQAATQRPSKAIYVMPTWRKSLILGEFDAKTGTYAHNPLFEKSSYYTFYQALISDPRLQTCLEQNGYTLKLVMHPNHVQEAHKFRPGARSEVVERCVYRDAFVDAAALVSDFSSVPFDFVLLGKPVVYAQFDRVEFFAGHTYSEGYFDYRRDGFGPVCSDLEQTVDAIIALVESDCKMPEKYQRRVNDFYGEQPECRCKEVVQVLHELGA
ncbi:MAG: CDP-glycerol glycerophosphotransferase family protein [Atopobiaceae bacterium]|nr:CDP-glycerol glycerophosphotransferase family protein [Atopobiaceae bacterium]